MFLRRVNKNEKDAVASALTVVSFAGCGSSNSKYAKGTSYKEGVLTADSYENASIGIGFSLPEGFEFTEVGVDAGNAEYLVAAVDADNNNIIWTLEPGASNLNIEKTLELSLDTIVTQYEGMGFTVGESKVTEYTIDSNTYGGFYIECEFQGVELNQAAVLVQCDDKVATASVTGGTVDSREILDNYFYTVG
ncbi:MAG: hypothetical protein E7583_08340 [Ruminococcaceae bacterium]|nr:hypothetical protein [Oscillospiraceae bacterium]